MPPFGRVVSVAQLAGRIAPTVHSVCKVEQVAKCGAAIERRPDGCKGNRLRFTVLEDGKLTVNSWPQDSGGLTERALRAKEPLDIPDLIESGLPLRRLVGEEAPHARSYVGVPAVSNQRVAQMLALVGLSDAARAYPHELSGGQQQRIALARALAPAPRLLLLDEPFSNLDTGTREHLADELRGLLKATGTTALLVTHDQAEAFAMADVVGIIAGGQIRQWDRAEVLYSAPADREVAAFIGRGSVLAAAALHLEGTGDVLLRPEQIVVDPHGPIRAVLVGSRFAGPGHVCRLRLAGGEVIEADLPSGPVPATGSSTALRLVGSAPVRLPGWRPPTPEPLPCAPAQVAGVSFSATSP